MIICSSFRLRPLGQLVLQVHKCVRVSVLVGPAGAASTPWKRVCTCVRLLMALRDRLCVIDNPMRTPEVRCCGDDDHNAGDWARKVVLSGESSIFLCCA